MLTCELTNMMTLSASLCQPFAIVLSSSSTIFEYIEKIVVESSRTSDSPRSDCSLPNGGQSQWPSTKYGSEISKDGNEPRTIHYTSFNIPFTGRMC